MSAGEDLRARREALGLSLDEVARATRIPIAHLEALEAETLEQLTSPAHAAAALRAVAESLGLVESTDGGFTRARVATGGGRTRSFLLGLGTAAMLALPVAWFVFGPRGEAEPEAEILVDVRALRSVRVDVTVDGLEGHRGVLEGGERLALAGLREVALDVGEVGAIEVRFGERRIDPVGLSDRPRRLVFVADGPP